MAGPAKAERPEAAQGAERSAAISYLAAQPVNKAVSQADCCGRLTGQKAKSVVKAQRARRLRSGWPAPAPAQPW